MDVNLKIMQWVKAIDRMPVRPKSYKEDCTIYVKDIIYGDKKVLHYGPHTKGRSLIERWPHRYAWLDEHAEDNYGSGYKDAIDDVKAKINHLTNKATLNI